MGPVLKAIATVEGELVEALMDTGSQLTIMQLEAYFSKQLCQGQTPSQWRTIMVESRLEPHPVKL